MTEYTSLEVSKRLYEAGFDGMGGFDNVGYPFKWLERTSGDADLVEGWHGVESGDGPIAYRSDTLLTWLLHRGDSLSIEPDLDGINITFWKDHLEYDGLETDLPDALAEVVLKVLEVSKCTMTA